MTGLVIRLREPDQVRGRVRYNGRLPEDAGLYILDNATLDKTEAIPLEILIDTIGTNGAGTCVVNTINVVKLRFDQPDSVVSRGNL